MDIDAYFNRIAYAGPRQPTLETLRALHLAHVCAIPYENLDIHFGRGISLDLATIERKFLRDLRGGYCFEHNLLFAAVLEQLGFSTTALAARVRWQRPPEVPSPLSHMILRIEAEGRPWLVDVGFGSMSLTAPLALDTDAEQTTPHEPRRLVRRGIHWVHQARLGENWVDAYLFTDEPQTLADFEVYNWFTSTSPASRFVQNVVAAKAAEGCRYSLLGTEFTRRFPDGRAEKKILSNEGEVFAVLADTFGLKFPPGTHFVKPRALELPF